MQSGIGFNASQNSVITALINNENLRSPTHTRVVDGNPSNVQPNRQRQNEAGKSLQEIIADMAAIERGYYFVEVPLIDRATNTYSEIVLRWPDAGTDRPAVRFEYGEGTLANVSSYTISEELPINGVTYAGGGSTPLTRRVTDSDSIAAYDLIEVFNSDPDVTQAATLTEKATAVLAPIPPWWPGWSSWPAVPLSGHRPPRGYGAISGWVTPCTYRCGISPPSAMGSRCGWPRPSSP